MLKDKVKEIRKEMGLTQVEFSKRLGISRSYYGDIERGRLKGNNVQLISKLSDVTGKPMSYFLDKDVDMHLYETLDTALDLIIAKDGVDNEGNILDENLKELVYNVLKQEIKLKLEIKSKR